MSRVAITSLICLTLGSLLLLYIGSVSLAKTGTLFEEDKNENEKVVEESITYEPLEVLVLPEPRSIYTVILQCKNLEKRNTYILTIPRDSIETTWAQMKDAGYHCTLPGKAYGDKYKP